MPDDAAEPADLRIELSVRQIDQLTRSNSIHDRDGIGVLRPFSGLLLGRRWLQFDHPAPPLAYLTLQPLVIEYLREHTFRETQTVTVEKIQTPNEAGTSDDSSTPDLPESLTVREYIKRQANSDEDGDGGISSLGSESDTPASEPVIQLDPEDRLTFNESTRFGPGRNLDDATSVISPRSPDRRSQPDQASSPIRSEIRGHTPPGMTLSTLTRTRDDEPARPMQASAFGFPVDVESAGVGTDTRPRAGRRPSHEGPELVLATPPVATGTAGGEAGSDASMSPRQARQRRELPPGGDGLRGDHPSVRSPRMDSRSSEPTKWLGPTAWSSSSTGQKREGATDDPTAVLDNLDRPDLDRFVERLADELARRERIERERRGL